MAKELTVLVIGERARMDASIQRAVEAVRRTGLECSVQAVETRLWEDQGVLDELLRHCRDAVDELHQMVITLRVEDAPATQDVAARVEAPDSTMLSRTLAEAIDSTMRRGGNHESHFDGPTTCRCDGFGCVMCLGEACP